MKKSSIALIGLLLVVAACNKSEKETPDGMKYKILKTGDGVTAKTGQVFMFDFLMKDSKDSVWQNTFASGMPAAVLIGDTSTLKTEGNMMQMFRQLSVGDSVQSELPVAKVYKEIMRRPLPPNIDSTLTITYQVKGRLITTREKYDSVQRDIVTKLEIKQLNKDTLAIDQYLKDKGIAAQRTKSGLRYIITQPGQGDTIKLGQEVKVNYSGYLLDGKYFDTNIKAVAEAKGLYDAKREPYEPFTVSVGRSRVIQGWHEALLKLNKGAKATFYIPSTLGYGPRASKSIPENSVLVFDIEALEVKDKDKAK